MKHGLWSILVAASLVACSAEDAEDAANSVQGGGPGIADANEMNFISDVTWLKSFFENLDQASIPWIWGSLIFMAEVGGVSGIPVVFDADNPPDIKVDLKVEVAGSAQLSNRAPFTIYDQADVSLTKLRLSELLSIDPENEKIPASVPHVGGKTIIPMYFLITMADYNWSAAGDAIKTQFSDALKAGDLTAMKDSVATNLPVPWLDCETTKITVKYKGTATEDGKYQLESTKYLAGDPQVTIDLLGQLANAGTPIGGFDIAKLVDALKSGLSGACEAPDATDQALFN